MDSFEANFPPLADAPQQPSPQQLDKTEVAKAAGLPTVQDLLGRQPAATASYLAPSDLYAAPLITAATTNSGISGTSPSITPSSGLLMPLKGTTPEELDVELHRLLIQTASTSNDRQLAQIIDEYQRRVIEPQSAGRSDLERTLLTSFLNRPDPEDGSCALILASCFGQLQQCYVLLNRGASVDVADKRMSLIFHCDDLSLNFP